MANLGELCGRGRLPVFERLAQGLPAVATALNAAAPSFRPALSEKAQKIYDRYKKHPRSQDIKQDLDIAFRTLQKAKRERHGAESIQKIEDVIKGLTRVLEERGLVGVGHPE